MTKEYAPIMEFSPIVTLGMMVLCVPINSDQLNLDVKRDNINLNNKKIQEKTGVKMRGINEGLLDMQKIGFSDSG